MIIDTEIILNVLASFGIELLASFGIGSIPFAVIAMWGSGTNIRDIGSGNPGFNNVLRFSKKRALISLVGDTGKGFLAVWLFYDPAGPVSLGWLFALGAVFGHCYSPWLRFNGGKGIATSAGAMLAIYPGAASAALVFFVLSRVAGSRFGVKERGAWASLLTWVFFTGLTHTMQGVPHSRNALLMTVFLMWRHKANIRRMFER